MDRQVINQGIAYLINKITLSYGTVGQVYKALDRPALPAVDFIDAITFLGMEAKVTSRQLALPIVLSYRHYIAHPSRNPPSMQQLQEAINILSMWYEERVQLPTILTGPIGEGELIIKLLETAVKAAVRYDLLLERQQAPSIAAQAPSIATQAPSIAIQAPSIAAQAPSIAIQAPSIAAQAPSIAIQAPSIARQPLSIGTELNPLAPTFTLSSSSSSSSSSRSQQVAPDIRSTSEDISQPPQFTLDEETLSQVVAIDTLKNLKPIWKEKLKQRKIIVLDGKHAGKKAKFLYWSGTVANVRFKGEKIALSLPLERKVAVLRSKYPGDDDEIPKQ